MMISRLRKRVVAVLMAALLLMTLSIMGCTIAINARQSVERQKEVLRSAAIMPLSRTGSSRSYRTTTPYFVVRITPGEDGSVHPWAGHGGGRCLRRGGGGAKYRQHQRCAGGAFPSVSDPHGCGGSTRMTFISTEEAALQLHTQIITCLILTPVLLLVLFLAVVLPLSRWLTRPVQQAWDKQKQFIADASHELKTP